MTLFTLLIAKCDDLQPQLLTFIRQKCSKYVFEAGSQVGIPNIDTTDFEDFGTHTSQSVKTKLGVVET